MEASRFAAMRCCVNCLEALDVDGSFCANWWRRGRKLTCCVFEDPQRC